MYCEVLGDMSLRFYCPDVVMFRDRFTAKYLDPRSAPDPFLLVDDQPALLPMSLASAVMQIIPQSGDCYILLSDGGVVGLE